MKIFIINSADIALVLVTGGGLDMLKTLVRSFIAR